MGLVELQARSTEYRRDGLCRACGEEPEPGRTLCARHLDYHVKLKRDLRARRQEAGACLDCGDVRDGEAKRCAPCRSKQQVRNNRYYSKRRTKQAAERRRSRDKRAAEVRRLRAAGKCVRCTRDAGRDRDLCLECHADVLLSQQAQRAERRAAGLCGCGRKSRPDRATCRRCAARSKARAKRLRRVRRQEGRCLGCSCKVLGAARCAKHLLAQSASRRRITRRRKAMKEVKRAA